MAVERGTRLGGRAKKEKSARFSRVDIVSGELRAAVERHRGRDVLTTNEEPEGDDEADDADCRKVDEADGARLEGGDVAEGSSLPALELGLGDAGANTLDEK